MIEQTKKLRLDDLQVESFVINGNLGTRTIKGADGESLLCQPSFAKPCNYPIGPWPISGSDGDTSAAGDPLSNLCPSGHQQIICG